MACAREPPFGPGPGRALKPGCSFLPPSGPGPSYRPNHPPNSVKIPCRTSPRGPGGGRYCSLHSLVRPDAGRAENPSLSFRTDRPRKKCPERNPEAYSTQPQRAPACLPSPSYAGAHVTMIRRRSGHVSEAACIRRLQRGFIETSGQGYPGSRKARRFRGKNASGKDWRRSTKGKDRGLGSLRHEPHLSKVRGIGSPHRPRFPAPAGPRVSGGLQALLAPGEAQARPAGSGHHIRSMRREAAWSMVATQV